MDPTLITAPIVAPCAPGVAYGVILARCQGRDTVAAIMGLLKKSAFDAHKMTGLPALGAHA